MSKKLQCQDCGQAEYGEDLYNYDNKILCRYCIVSRVYEGSTPCEYVGTCNDKTFLNKADQIDQLKQQLKEYKNKENTFAVNSWDEMLKNCENCGLNECIGCEYTQTCVQNIKQQLAEKDKEIERLKERLSVFDNFKDNYGYTNYDDSEILEDLQSRAFQAEDDTRVVNELLQFFNIFDENELVDKVKEPQTQLAIHELEKVKNLAVVLLDDFCHSIHYSQKEFRGHRYIEFYDLIRGIDNQIKELKGEKDAED